MDYRVPLNDKMLIIPGYFLLNFVELIIWWIVIMWILSIRINFYFLFDSYNQNNKDFKHVWCATFGVLDKNLQLELEDTISLNTYIENLQRGKNYIDVFLI